MNKKVSIIIPVYNGSNYLREAIDSALAQTYENVEVIVVNDGSNDNGATEEIALSYGEKIRYFKKENGGVATALNLGIQKMEGEYFSWLSHDDVYYPDKVKKEIDAIVASGDETTLVQCEYDFYDMGSKTYTPTDFYKYYTLEQLTNSVFSVLQLQIHACAALVHKSHFERVGMFDEGRKFTQDVEMWFRLFRGQKSLWVKERLYAVRVHGESDSKNYYDAWNKENAQLYLEIFQKMSDEELAKMYAKPETALCRIIGLIRSREGYREAQVLEHRLQQCYEKACEKKLIEEASFREYLDELSGEERKKLVLFGAGQYGIRLLYELQQRRITVDMFMDNNPAKQGTKIEGVPCDLVDNIADQKQDVLVIITQRTCESAMQQLKKLGFPYVITRQELDGVLLQYAPQP